VNQPYSADILMLIEVKSEKDSEIQKVITVVFAGSEKEDHENEGEIIMFG
jgi:hypothetical protein